MTATAHERTDIRRAEKRGVPFVAGGAGTEVIAGAGAVVLTILALLGMADITLTAIAVIAIGAGLLVQGTAIAAKWRAVNEVADARTTRDEALLGGGMTAEMVAGAGGITLGILALLGLIPETLLAAAAIAFGGAMIFGSGTQQELSSIGSGQSKTRQVALTGAGGELLVGLAAVTLGILALIFEAFTLTAIAALTVGAGLLLGGSTLLARVGNALMS